MPSPDPQQTVASLFRLLSEQGESEYLGEEVTQLQHMAQAGTLAAQSGQDNETILAAFLHDIGHLLGHDSTLDMNGLGHLHHDEAGAKLLEHYGFSAKVVTLVANHVNAKRFLCQRKPEYHDQLSEASKQTLIFQGGPMSEAEAADFQQNPLFSQILTVRDFDERAKDPEDQGYPIKYFKDLALRHLLAQRV